MNPLKHFAIVHVAVEDAVVLDEDKRILPWEVPTKLVRFAAYSLEPVSLIRQRSLVHVFVV